jgi:hypothetical protein
MLDMGLFDEGESIVVGAGDGDKPTGAALGVDEQAAIVTLDGLALKGWRGCCCQIHGLCKADEGGICGVYRFFEHVTILRRRSCMQLTEW